MLEAPALIARLHDVAVVREAVEQGGCHLGVAEDAAPFREGEVGGLLVFSAISDGTKS